MHTCTCARVCRYDNGAKLLECGLVDGTHVWIDVGDGDGPVGLVGGMCMCMCMCMCMRMRMCMCMCMGMGMGMGMGMCMCIYGPGGWHVHVCVDVYA